MNRLIQHIPSYCSGFEREVIEFDSLQELLDHDFIKNFVDGFLNFKFIRFSIEGKYGPPYSLMVEHYDEDETKEKWLVVGYLDEDILEFPRWQPPARDKHNNEGV